MTHVVVIGANGLIGTALARLLAREHATSLLLVDRDPTAPPPGAAIPVECRTGDFCDEAFARAALHGADCVVHLAALLATETELHPERGFAVNVAGPAALLRFCADLPRPPRFLYASSIAAFGGTLPPVVTDAVARTPRTAYGTHKAVMELLIDDATRRGAVDGRVLRLPIVLVRGGPPGTAVSDRVAALVREPLLGHDLVCGIDPDTRMVVASAARVARAFLRLATLDAAAFGPARALNLPSLSLTAAELAAAAARAPVARQGRIDWRPDPALQRVLDGWPQGFASDAAEALGLGCDETADDIVAGFVAERGLA